MSVESKKRRLARRVAMREGKPVSDTRVAQIMETLDQITNKQIKEPKNKPYLSTSEFLKRKREALEAKKEFRAHRNQHRLENERAAEKATKAAKREERRLREEKRAQREQL